MERNVPCSDFALTAQRYYTASLPYLQQVPARDVQVERTGYEFGTPKSDMRKKSFKMNVWWL